MIKLYCENSLKLLQSYADNQFDVVVTDPPYGISESGKKNKSRGKLALPKNYGDYNWDSERIAPIFIREILRVSKHQVIFGGNYYADLLPPSSSWIVWDKLNTGNFADCELAWTSHSKAVRKFTYLWNGMIKAKPEKRYHPTQKPLALMMWVIYNYTNPNDTILDPFLGSGTTGVAAKQLGRVFVGIDNNQQYVDIAEQRINDAQPPLFVLDSKNTGTAEQLSFV